MLRKYNNHTIIIIIISDNIEASFVLVLHGHVENKDSAVIFILNTSKCVQVMGQQLRMLQMLMCPTEHVSKFNKKVKLTQNY